MSDYILYAIYKKAGRFDGRVEIGKLTTEKKMDEVASLIHHYCESEDIENVALELYAPISFEQNSSAFDVAREFPKVKPRTFVTFFVKRDDKETPKNMYGTDDEGYIIF